MGTSSTLVNQPRTILGPLTTTFTPPISCGYINAPRTFPNGRIGWRGQSCKSDSMNGMIDATQCWPPTTAGAAYPSSPFLGWGFYSPGFACPHGYTSACTATANGDAQWPVQFMMSDGETAVGCCPSGYTCFNMAISGASCSLLATSTTVTMALCNSEDTMSLFMKTFPYLSVLTTTAGEPPTITTTTMIESVTAWAPMIQINWRSADRTTTPASIPSSTTSSLNTTIPGNENASDISIGAIIGIVAGCLVFMAAIWATWFFIRLKRRRALHVDTMSLHQGQCRTPADLLQMRRDDRRCSGPIEMGDERNPPELPGTRLVVELDASSSGCTGSRN